MDLNNVNKWRKVKISDLFQVGTPKPSDNWEKRKGFTMSRRKMELFEFNKERLVSIRYLEA